jgi:phenylacetate-CoA ligase
VLSAYQAIESGQVAFECEEGRELAEGHSGDVVISDLTNRATVLLNYRLGDVAAARPPCPCGRTLPMISLLEGRSVEWLSGPSGERFHPQTALAVLRFEAGIRRYQVVQRSPTHLDVAVVLAPGVDEARSHRESKAALAGQFPPSMRITVRSVDDLPRTPGGKVRPVVSLLDRQELRRAPSENG